MQSPSENDKRLSSERTLLGVLPQDPWSEHRDINEVMLATSLVPEGFLVLPSLY
jgi:hypothetical protein